MISVKYFGAVAEKTKSQGENVVSADKTLQELLEDLKQKYDLGSLSFSIAVNQKIVQDTKSYVLNTNDVVALLPPFAGG